MISENSIATLAKVQDVEFITKFTKNIQELLTILNVSQPIKLPAGSALKMYKTEGELGDGAVAAGEDVPASKYNNLEQHVSELKFSKFRKKTPIEDVSKMGFSLAVDRTDEHMIADIQGTIMKFFFDHLKYATSLDTAKSEVSGEDLQATMAKARGALRKACANFSFTPVTFISTDDLTDYLSKAEITLQNAFGLSYIEQFLNLGLTIEDPTLPKGTMYTTAAENLNFYCADPSQIEGFEFYTDETGVIGVKHEPTYTNESFQTHAVSAARFMVSYADKVIKGTIGSGSGSGAKKS